MMSFALMALVGPGDEVIVPDPGFPIYESMTRFMGATPVPLPLRQAADFRPDLDELRSLVGPRTRMLILNSPSNPTGSVLTAGDIEAIAEVAVAHDLVVLADEIYGRIVYGAEHHSVLSVDGMAELYDRWARLIRAICFDTTHNLDAAEDIAQEVFVRALEKLGVLRDPQRFAPWLVGIAKRVCREWQRGVLRDRRRPTRIEDSLRVTVDEDPPDERLEFLSNALAGLPHRERLSLQAFYLQGLDPKQARAALGLSKSTFYRVLASARGRLRKALARQEVLP